MFLEKAKNSAKKFRSEFKKQSITAITAAFAFLVALSWRDPISQTVNSLISKLGIGQQLVYKFLSAVIVTFLAVLVIVALSKWATEPTPQPLK
ncbi:hypothetical protein COV15_01270 [Candidatus Woesearchaeota archaeon CG10_big_fil_rev_8_21_14_0_10_34_12]|nr:MAG: hypothetical protein COV15_01270 [Candidatus Woesearchaeota archaeon CG10_big_fil_rev_8_21_14_0_10_34_12]